MFLELSLELIDFWLMNLMKLYWLYLRLFIVFTWNKIVIMILNLLHAKFIFCVELLKNCLSRSSSHPQKMFHVFLNFRKPHLLKFWCELPAYINKNFLIYIFLFESSYNTEKKISDHVLSHSALSFLWWYISSVIIKKRYNLILFPHFHR